MVGAWVDGKTLLIFDENGRNPKVATAQQCEKYYSAHGGSKNGDTGFYEINWIRDRSRFKAETTDIGAVMVERWKAAEPNWQA
jgi:hypothetical protein